MADEETRPDETDVVARLRAAAKKAEAANDPSTASLFHEAAAAIVMLRSINEVAQGLLDEIKRNKGRA